MMPMKFTRDFLSYIMLFLVGLLLLNMFGLLYVTVPFVISLVLIITGITIVYAAFGLHRWQPLTIGSTMFFSGLLLYFIEGLLFSRVSQLFIVSALMIAAMNFLVLFFDDPSRKWFLFNGIILQIAVFVGIALGRTIDPLMVFVAAWGIITGYWYLFVIILAVILILFLTDLARTPRDY